MKLLAVLTWWCWTCSCPADPTERTSGEIESVAIMLAVALIVLVTAFINWAKELQFRGLQQQIDKQLQSLVVRSGDIRQLPSSDLVVGDICIIKYGIIMHWRAFPFSALTLLSRLQEGHPACKKMGVGLSVVTF